MLAKKVSDLAPNLRNPRRITDKQLEMLKKSLDEFGDLGCIVFNERTGRLVGGHQRIKVLPPEADIVIMHTYNPPTRTGTVAEGHVVIAGEKFKYRVVDFIEQKEMAANIAANRHSGEFEFTFLNEQLLELEHANYDMELVGYDDDELEKQLAYTPDINRIEPLCDEDEVPEKVEPKTRLGDLYRLGNHRLMCGDSTSIDAVERLMNGEKADMVFTDPPYGIDEETDRAFAGRTRKCKGNTFHKIIGDDSIDTALAAFSISDNQSDIVCYWGGNYYAHKLVPSPCWIVWDKRVEDNQRNMNSDCELAYVKHPSKESVRIFRHLWKGMIKGSEHGQGRVHPTQKPVALAEWAFSELDPKGKSVLDLFGGSGSTIIACEKTNRRCFMMELDPHYCDVIIARWEKYTGNKAQLLS